MFNINIAVKEIKQRGNDMNTIIEKFLMATMHTAVCLCAALFWMVLGVSIYYLVAHITGL